LDGKEGQEKGEGCGSPFRGAVANRMGEGARVFNEYLVFYSIYRIVSSLTQRDRAVLKLLIAALTASDGKINNN